VHSTLNYHVIKDPVHGVMEFSSQEDAWIKPFIDHPLFQRLRHIKQSGMADLIFPGATHTRLNHGLGCCYIASQMAKKIHLSDQDRQLVMIAGLLHDIGHGPFSHTIEDLFPDRAIRHEMWTPYFLEAFHSDAFLSAYNQRNPEMPLDRDKLIDIQQIIMHEHENKLLTDIVSSQLDADRFDYLLRDSHFCGVSYGQFDLRWMLHCLTIVPTDTGPRLGVTYKGIGVVEHYLMARRLMIRNIYHHYKKFAIERLLVRLFHALSECMQTEPFLEQIRQSLLGRYITHAIGYIKQIAQEGMTEANKRAFFQENFALYCDLRDYHVTDLIAQLVAMEHKHDVIELAKRIHFRHLPEIYFLDIEQMDAVTQAIAQIKQQHGDIRDWQLQVLKMPQLSYTGEDSPIYVRDKTGEIYPITDVSLMVDSLSDTYEHACSLFVDHQVLDKVDLSFL